MIYQVKQREAELRGEARGEAKGEARGRKEGLAEGARNMAVETAKRMLKESFPVDVITRISGLSASEVNALKQSRNTET